MISSANSDTERKILSILRVLSESSEPLGSITIARELEKHGLSLGERAVRYHLKITDERGYTQPLGIDGRMITSRGLDELRIALAPDQIGFILEKLELLAFRTTFSPESRTGQLPINTSLFNKNDFPRAMAAMKGVFKAGMCVSDLVATASEGQKLGDVVIPNGKIGMATVCGVTGNGKILANFREIPAPARSIVEETITELKTAGINGVLALGNISEPVCQIALGMNRVGMVLLGGLNPVAAAVEARIEVENIAESGMIV